MTDDTVLARRLLQNMGVGTDDPRWSSALLRESFDKCVPSQGGSLQALYHIAFGLLHDCSLNTPVATFIKDFAVCGFTQFRNEFLASDFSRLLSDAEQGITPSQAYFLLSAIPPEQVNSQIVVAMLRALSSTEFRAEGFSSLSEDLSLAEAQLLLKAWLSEEPCPDVREYIRAHIA